MDLTKLTEETASGGCAAFTRARIGGGEDKIVRKPVEKKKGTGLKPDALTSFVKGYRKAR
jgi:hypothetical protein